MSETPLSVFLLFRGQFGLISVSSPPLGVEVFHKTTNKLVNKCEKIQKNPKELNTIEDYSMKY